MPSIIATLSGFPSLAISASAIKLIARAIECACAYALRGTEWAGFARTHSIPYHASIGQ